ncbi:MAG: IS1634 family transposase [Chitinispirillia bacterium]
MSQMKENKKKKLKKHIRGAIPLIQKIAKRMKLREILTHYIQPHGNEKIYAVDTLLLLIYNLAIEKNPLYELSEWCSVQDVSALGIQQQNRWFTFTDDRFGKALDKLYLADRSSLMTEIVTTVVKQFDISMDRIHNDSTSVKAFGKIPGITRTGLELKKGVSKDHRPDLKQLVFSLSISSDGAVPIHHKCYSGNRTDDTTHIETWNTLRKITGRADFLYVADSKLCTQKQLSYIVGKGGRAITILPETWSEVNRFKQELLKTAKSKTRIWRRQKPGSDTEEEYFSVFKGKQVTKKEGFRIHWIYSNEKRKRDRSSREINLKKLEKKFMEVNSSINTGKLKSFEQIKNKIVEIREEGKSVESFVWNRLNSKSKIKKAQVGKGRPSKKTKYREITETYYTLTWGRNKEELNRQNRIDGIFPLLSTDESLSSLDVLKAYKYQPRLEKRFEQLKQIHLIAPLLFKKIDRVEANMFAFFIGLLIQTLLEREVRLNMKNNEIEKMYIYPEQRECKNPTTAIIFDRFSNVSRYEIFKGNRLAEEYRDELSKTQKDILRMIEMNEDTYWD